MVELQLVDYEGGKEGGGSVRKKDWYWLLSDSFRCLQLMIFGRGRRWAANVLMIPVSMDDWNVGYTCNQPGCESMMSHYLVRIAKMNRTGEELVGGDATKDYWREDGVWNRGQQS